MSTADPEHANRSLSRVRFLSSPAHLAAYGALVNRTQALARDEQITIPPYQEADAWQKLYSQYRLLKEKRRSEDTPEAQLAAAQAAQSGLEWADYLQKRNELLATSYTREEGEYVGLRDGDLCNPVVDGPDGLPNPRPDWQSRHGRITSALWHLRNMSHVERGNISNILETRRVKAELEGMKQQLEAFKDWFDKRISILEAKQFLKKH